MRSWPNFIGAVSKLFRPEPGPETTVQRGGPNKDSGVFPQRGGGSRLGREGEEKKRSVKLHTVARKNAFLLSEKERKEWPIHGRRGLSPGTKLFKSMIRQSQAKKALLGIHCTFSTKVP